MVTPVARRRPWKLAKEITTLDHLSGGRVIVGTVWIRSQPATGKIANIRHQPRVAFNLNSDGQGAGVTLKGTASFVDDLPPGVRDEYIAKYQQAIRGGPRTTRSRCWPTSRRLSGSPSTESAPGDFRTS
jgi:Pyridoxamine 5'-phosphate oxidase